MKELETELHNLKSSGLWRNLSCLNGIDFSSNDYLGLARSSIIRKQLINYLETSQLLGSTGSRLVSGETELSRETEDFLAKLFHSESALLFGSGYLANLGVMTALGNESSEFFSDKLNHASLIDGMRLTKSRINTFNHNDLNHLETLLRASQANRKIVVTESVFSMDGDSPDLEKLVALVEKFDAILVVDEAHATGVCGTDGLGLLRDVSHDSIKTIGIHTCGKALGAYGAFVTSSEPIRYLFINKARSFIYSTAIPPLLLVQIRFALKEIIHGDSLRIRLADNINTAREMFDREGILLRGSHIGFIQFDGNHEVVTVAEFLQSNGFHVKAIRSPTVPAGKERIRITLKSFHKKEEIKSLAQVIGTAML